jgi:hypothetical protein
LLVAQLRLGGAELALELDWLETDDELELSELEELLLEA